MSTEYGEYQGDIANLHGLAYREIRLENIVYYRSLIYHHAGNS